MGALGTLPGPKAVFYVSGGLEQRPAIDLFHQIGEICPEALHRDFSQVLAPMQEYDLSGAFRALAARANASRVTLNTVDASGIQNFSAADVSYDALVSHDNRRYAPSAKTDRIRIQNLRAGQVILAEETGGSAIFDASDVRKPLEQLAGQVRGAYALGFRPDHGAEGRTHGLRVEVARKGVQLRYPPSYRHAVRPEPGTARTLAALLAGLEEDTLGAVVALDPAAPSAGAEPGAPRVRVRIRVPRGRLEGAGRVRVVIATWRAGSPAKDRLLDVREELLDVAPLGATDAADAMQEFVVEVPLAAGHPELAVGVHDVHSSRVTYQRLRSGS